MVHPVLWTCNRISSQPLHCKRQYTSAVAALQGPLDRRLNQRAKKARQAPSAVNLKETAQLDRPVTAPVSDVSTNLKSVVGVLENSLSLDAGKHNAGIQAAEEEFKMPAEFRSKLSHKVITGGSIILISALLAKGVLELEGPLDVTAGLMATLFGYFLSDFLTGVYHWSVDNYGDGSTPVVGTQIEAFQGHHQKPWTITQREFCNNLHKVFLPVAPWTALCLAVSPWTPSWLDIGLATATFLTAMSQQFHAWAHMKPSHLPDSVKMLQDAGLLVSRKAHGAHHKAPFEGNYCIVSGFWNPILDQDGSQSSFFRSLERIVAEKTGVEPRCWYEPDYSWQEE